jgi:hypothetical protein
VARAAHRASWGGPASRGSSLLAWRGRPVRVGRSGQARERRARVWAWCTEWRGPRRFLGRRIRRGLGKRAAIRIGRRWRSVRSTSTRPSRREEALGERASSRARGAARRSHAIQWPGKRRWAFGRSARSDATPVPTAAGGCRAASARRAEACSRRRPRAPRPQHAPGDLRCRGGTLLFAAVERRFWLVTHLETVLCARPTNWLRAAPNAPGNGAVRRADQLVRLLTHLGTVLFAGPTNWCGS